MNWIPIEKEMPEEGKPVLVTDGEDVWSASWSAIGETVYWFCHGFTGYDMDLRFGYPTYWTELPEPPQKGI